MNTPVSPSVPASAAASGTVADGANGGWQMSADATQRAQRVRVLAMDVDGTLTDGRIHIGNQGEIMKSFSVHDGFGLSLLRRSGIRLAIITGRESQIVRRRAAELQIDAVVQGAADKCEALIAVARDFGLTPDQAAFIGDDWPDIGAMRVAALAAAVVTAPPEVRAAAHWVGSARPGEGAVRQLCDWLLTVTDRMPALRRSFQA